MNDDQPYHYGAFGLNIRSSFRLPELRPAPTTRHDVVLRTERIKGFASSHTPDLIGAQVTGEGIHFQYKEVGSFLVRNGHEILIEPAQGVEADILRLFILGPAMAVLLHQRRALVLHASAITGDGGVVAFLGGSGWGKSTLVATLHGRGYDLINDDVVAIDLGHATHPLVLPGSPFLKLWPEWATQLRVLNGRLMAIKSQQRTARRKALYRAASAFPESPLPLLCLFVLAEAPVLGIERLHPRQALIELVRHTYCARLLKDLNPAEHFHQCANLVGRIPVCRLQGPRTLEALPHLLDLVETHLGHVTC